MANDAFNCKTVKLTEKFPEVEEGDQCPVCQTGEIEKIPSGGSYCNHCDYSD